MLRAFNGFLGDIRLKLRKTGKKEEVEKGCSAGKKGERTWCMSWGMRVLPAPTQVEYRSQLVVSTLVHIMFTRIPADIGV